MASETFDGSSLVDTLKLLQESGERAKAPCDDFSDDSSEGGESTDSDEDVHEPRVDSLRRFHVDGAASRVTPFTDLSDHVHNGLLSNVSFSQSDRVPLLVQYLTPLLMAEYDALVVAPPGKAQLEALLIPIVNKILLSMDDGARLTEKRPRAVILSSNMHERWKILEVVKALTKDLSIATLETRSIDDLKKFFDCDSPDGQLDILITTPAAFIAFTRRKAIKNDEAKHGKYPALLSMDRLRYMVVIELEELCDAEGDYSKILSNHRKEKEFTLVMLTHTHFANRGANKKKLSLNYAERRSKLENLLNDDHGLVMVDSTLCIRNFVLVNNSDSARLEHLRAILEDHHSRYYKVTEKGHKFEKRVLIVVPNEERARFIKAYLTAGGDMRQLIDPRHLLHLERDTGRKDARGMWKDPTKKMKTGQVIGVISSNIHGVRMAHSVVDKVIFVGVVPSMHSLVLNCSKVIDNRRNFFLLDKNDLRNKKEELRSLVQYLKDVDTEIPPALREFESPPASVKSIYK